MTILGNSFLYSQRRSQVPDPATKARAVPIYQTTVSVGSGVYAAEARLTRLSHSHSMTRPTARDFLVSKSLATSIAEL